MESTNTAVLVSSSEYLMESSSTAVAVMESSSTAVVVSSSDGEQ